MFERIAIATMIAGYAVVAGCAAARGDYKSTTTAILFAVANGVIFYWRA